MNRLQGCSHDGMKACRILRIGYASLIILLESLASRVPELFFVADHDDCILQIICRVAAFLLPGIGSRSDHGRSDAACYARGNFHDKCCTQGSLRPKAISSLHSSSERRKGTASDLHVLLLASVFALSPAHHRIFVRIGIHHWPDTWIF